MLSFLTKGQLIAGNTKAWLMTNSRKELSFSDHIHSNYATNTYVNEQINIVNDNISKLAETIQGANGEAFSYSFETQFGQNQQYTIPVNFDIKRIIIFAGANLYLQIYDNSSHSNKYYSIISETDITIANGGTATIMGGTTWNPMSATISFSGKIIYCDSRAIKGSFSGTAFGS